MPKSVLAYRYHAIAAPYPTAFTVTLRDMLDALRSWYPGANVGFKPDEYGEGWVCVNGVRVGYLDRSWREFPNYRTPPPTALT